MWTDLDFFLQEHGVTAAHTIIEDCFSLEKHI